LLRCPATSLTKDCNVSLQYSVCEVRKLGRFHETRASDSRYILMTERGAGVLHLKTIDYWVLQVHSGDRRCRCCSGWTALEHRAKTTEDRFETTPSTTTAWLSGLNSSVHILGVNAWMNGKWRDMSYLNSFSQASTLQVSTSATESRKLCKAKLDNASRQRLVPASAKNESRFLHS
jgi:hypothetical protein